MLVLLFPLILIWEDPENDSRWNKSITLLVFIWEDLDNDLRLHVSITPIIQIWED